MRKIVFSLTTGMVAACALAMLTAVNAANNTAVNAADAPAANAADDMVTEDIDLNLEFTDDDSDLDLPLPTPDAPKAAPQENNTIPAKEMDLAQTLAPEAPATPAAGAVDANVSNILAEPALNPPAVKTPAAPVEPANAPVKITPEAKIPQLPPVEQSIVNAPGTGETLPPAVTIDPTMEMGTPYGQPIVQTQPGTSLAYNGPAPIRAGGSCPNCPQGVGYGYGGPVTNRPVYYGVQRNGLPAYPRAGNCCGCGGCGCPGCCGRRAPMPYSYYTLRGPRDFDDPNPRPIGP